MINKSINQGSAGVNNFAPVYSEVFPGKQQDVRDLRTWPDTSLIVRIKLDQSAELALDTLIARHWKPLFARCQMFTSDLEEAYALARMACKHALQGLPFFPATGDFRAHLVLTATHLWRNQVRSAQLNESVATTEILTGDLRAIDAGIKISFAGAVTNDLKTMAATEQSSLRQEIDLALAALAPMERDLVLACYLNGESHAEIGRRHNQSEEIVRGWLKAALQRIKTLLGPQGTSTVPAKKSN